MSPFQRHRDYGVYTPITERYIYPSTGDQARNKCSPRPQLIGLGAARALRSGRPARIAQTHRHEPDRKQTAHDDCITKQVHSFAAAAIGPRKDIARAISTSCVRGPR